MPEKPRYRPWGIRAWIVYAIFVLLLVVFGFVATASAAGGLVSGMSGVLGATFTSIKYELEARANAEPERGE